MIIKVNYTVSDIYMSTSVSAVYIKVVYSGVSAGGGGTWGTITGTLSNQTDLQNALDAKVPYSGATGAVNLGAFGITAASLIKSGGTSAQFLKADGSVDSSTYQSALTLTTTGTSGAATLVGATLNIPQYAAGITGSGVANQLTYWNGTGSVTGSTGLVYNDSTGAITLNKNQNNSTGISVTNTTIGINSETFVSVSSDASAGGSAIGKYSSTHAAFKILNATDAFITNAGLGDLAFLNQVAAGKIKFAAGSSSTAQMTLTAAGRLLLGTTTESTFILDVNGTARFSDRITSTITGNSAIVIDETAFLTLGAAGQNIMSGSAASIIGGGTTGLGIRYSNGVVIGTGTLGYHYLTNNYALFSSQSGAVNLSSGIPASAVLEARSITKGFLPPRMTTIQRDAIASPATGLQVYNTTTNTNDFYNGTSWSALASGNIYTTNGTLTGNRTLTLGGFTLDFIGSTHTNRFTSAGRLLLGTTSESTFILDVNGTARVSGALVLDGFTNPTTCYLSLRNGFDPTSVGGSGITAKNNAGTSADGLGIWGNDGISFNTAQVERMLISQTGVISFPNSTTLSATTMSSALVNGILSLDAFNNPTTSYIALRNGFAPSISGGIGFTAKNHQDANADGLGVWGMDGISFQTAITERARITAAGRLLIGTTTESTYLLDVNGTARVSGALTAANNSVIGGVTFVGSDAVDFSSSISLRYGGNVRLNITSTNTSIGGSVGTTMTLNTNSISIGETGGISSTNAKIMLGQYAGYSSSTNGDFVSIGAASFFSTTNPTNGIAIGGRNAGAGAARGNTGNHTTCFFFGSNTGAATNSVSLSNTYIIGNDVRTDLSNVFMLGKSNQTIMVGEGTSVGSGAIIQIDSTTKGFLPPRMTTAQINAIVTPAEGLQVYNTTINHMCFYQNGAWAKISHSPM